jgi:dihydroneopterin aldolase
MLQIVDKSGLELQIHKAQRRIHNHNYIERARIMDILQITALNIKTHIGVHTWEQAILQTVTIDIQIPMDFSTCHDQLENTIDYAQLSQQVTQHVESNRFTLIETLAEQVAKLIKDEFKVNEITLTVSKPHAIKNAGNVSVTLTR